MWGWLCCMLSHSRPSGWPPTIGQMLAVLSNAGLIYGAIYHGAAAELSPALGQTMHIQGLHGWPCVALSARRPKR